MSESAVQQVDLARQAPAFLIVGALGFCFDACLTVTLASGLGLSPYIARPPAVIIATLTTFLLNRVFTFKSVGGDWRVELARYLVVAASGQALNYAVYAGALALFAVTGHISGPAPIAAAIACGSGAAMVLTFTGFRFFAFRA
jgi:putative flippase GtrA